MIERQINARGCCAGEGRPEEGGGVLLAGHARRPRRRRDHVAVRQAGVGGAPRPREVPRLLPEVGAGRPAEQVHPYVQPKKKDILVLQHVQFHR